MNHLKIGRSYSAINACGKKSEKPLSSLLVCLNDWLNFRVRDQSEIKMLTARGHSDISLPADVLWGSFVTECVEAIVTLTQHFLSSFHYFAAVLFAFVFLFRVAFVYSF